MTDSYCGQCHKYHDPNVRCNRLHLMFCETCHCWHTSQIEKPATIVSLYIGQKTVYEFNAATGLEWPVGKEDYIGIDLKDQVNEENGRPFRFLEYRGESAEKIIALQLKRGEKIIFSWPHRGKSHAVPRRA